MEAKLKIQSLFASMDGGGLGLPFLSHSPMKENKAQRKEGENEGIFFGFGDDLAVDDNPH